jgi:hypothetical protein
MHYNQLGKSDLSVSAVSLGTAPLATCSAPMSPTRSPLCNYTTSSLPDNNGGDTCSA